MNEIKQWLFSYGLNKKEIDVYTIVLQHSGCKVSDIQKETGFVRTSIYYAINQLKAQGLIFENIDNNIRTFQAQNISVFRDQIEQKIRNEQEKLQSIGAIEEALGSLVKDNLNESYVSRYEGIRSVKSSIEEALRCNSKTWHVLAARDNFLAHMPKSYQQYYLQERKRRNIKAKTLWEPLEKSAKISLSDTALRSPRRLPDSFAGKFNSLVIIYDDTVLIIDPYEQKTAHAINSIATANLMRMMFMAIWDSAERA